MRLATWHAIGVWAAIASGCGAKSLAQGDAVASDAAVNLAADAVDAAEDVSIVAPPKNYTAKFRVLLANPAPADLQEGERIYYEDAFGTETLGDWPPASWLVKLWQSDKAKWGEQFSKFGWLVDPGDDLPVGFKRGIKNPALVHETCASCHVTKLDDGRYWSGMPATHLQWAQFRLSVNEAWVKDGHPALVTAQGITKLQGILQPGSGNADSVADKHIVPADFPLYVNLGKRHNLGYTGVASDSRSQVWLSMYTFGAGDDLPFPPESITTPFDAYMAWMEPPKPLKVADNGAAHGQAVFVAAKCATCHHVEDIGKDGASDYATDTTETFPDFKHTSGTIRTDPLFYGLADSSDPGSGPGPGLAKLINFIIDNALSVGSPSGYAVSDLHGIFASAPYLHNGSVPTLDDLLKPAKDRPKTFVREGFTVDTSKMGMSNIGHEFGTQLAPNDKSDLIAYLNSL